MGGRVGGGGEDTERRHAEETENRDLTPRYRFPSLCTSHVSRSAKIQIVSSPGSVIRPQLITTETAIGPLKAWVNVPTCRNEGRLKILRSDFDRQTTNATRSRKQRGERVQFSRDVDVFENVSKRPLGYSAKIAQPEGAGGESRVFWNCSRR